MNPPPESRPRYKDVHEAARIYFLPNLATAGNLFFGFVAMILCIRARYVVADEEVNQYYTQAVWCILLAAVCDALDGRLARLGGRESLFGKEFDSIADTVSFGVAPALMVFFLILGPSSYWYSDFFREVGWFIGYIYLLCVAVRLARFNVLTSPLLPGVSPDAATKDFMGLPSPAAAGFIASLVLVLLNWNEAERWALVLPPLLLLVAYLMVSNIPYPSFKHIGWQTQTRARSFILFVVLIAIVILFREFSFAILFLCYIFYGLGRHLRRNWRKHHRSATEPQLPEEPEEEDAF
ncbi:MAG: CDP-diacylglycerol--serine O-phosphatidyltransferase [Opitutales bacterium]|jgi:CDP-diacylglycerol--serine O-phosphatidyltransferase